MRRLVTFACLLSIGCAADSGRPATVPVEGQVTYRGKPVAGATVAFLCPGAPRIAVGTTDQMGHYRLTTFDPDDGAVVGTHVVTVKKYAADGVETVAPAEPKDREAMAKAIEKAMTETALRMKKSGTAESILPEKYGDRKTSDLRKEVVAGDNIINLELSD